MKTVAWIELSQQCIDPREAGLTVADSQNAALILVGTQDRHERFLADLNTANRLHSFLALFLFTNKTK